MSKLKDKVAVITGGTSGIGLATAEEFIAEGAHVIITGRKESELKKVANEIGAEGLVADQAKLADIDKLVELVKSKFGFIDILFINAGIVLFSSIEEATEEHFDRMMDINFKGSFFTLSKFIPLMRRGSVVTLLSSINATTGQSNCSVYSAGKAALNSLVKVASSELSSKGVRINAVCPGPIKTNLVSALGLEETALQKFASATLSKIPLKRFGEAAEVAKLVTFLSSDDAAFITGSEYVIDGGTNVNSIVG
jgi:NAD(P)-dependent dehydrogenase (short-subunit alcohol dehydrogenase family)